MAIAEYNSFLTVNNVLSSSNYGIGSQVRAMLPWSRQQETEADQFGLIFAAMAGYDP